MRTTTRAPQFPSAAHLCEVANATSRKWEPLRLGCPAVDPDLSEYKSTFIELQTMNMVENFRSLSIYVPYKYLIIKPLHNENNCM